MPFSLEGFKGCNAARILVWPQAVIPGLVDEQFGLQVRAAGEVQLPPFFLEGPDKNAGSVFEHPQDGPKGEPQGCGEYLSDIACLFWVNFAHFIERQKGIVMR